MNKEVKTFENEVKFKITKVKNASFTHTLQFYIDSEGERIRSCQADR